jgi:4-hydroxy-tetrahydrodipicolinate synthase
VTEPPPSLADRTRELASQLDGTLIPAVPVPRYADGRIHAEGQQAYAAWMSRQPVAGIAVWAHTGRGLHLDETARHEVMHSWRSTMPATTVIVAGCGVPAGGAPLPTAPRARTDEIIARSMALARAAAAGGASALLVHPPASLADLPDAARRVVAVHEALADAGLPLIAFLLYERASGLEYDDALLDELLGLPHVAGVKLATLDSVMRFQTVAEHLASNHPSRLLITGEDRFLGYSLMIGARCALIGLGAARTAMQHALVRASVTKDAAALIRLTSACDQLARATFVEPMEGYIRRMLWVLAEDGIIPDEACHDPIGPPLDAGERRRVVNAVRSLDALL